MLRSYRPGPTDGCSWQGLWLGDGTGLVGKGIGKGRQVNFVVYYVNLKVQNLHCGIKSEL